MHRVLAVTCDRWPDNFCLDSEEPEADVSPLAEFAAASVQFHSHYVQQPCVELIDVPHGCVIEVGRQSPPEAIAKVIGELSPQRFVHLEVGNDAEAAELSELLTRTLREILRFFREREEADERWLTIVTAGAVRNSSDIASSVTATGAFGIGQDRQLFPVPLWLRLPHREVGHSAALTGSGDLAATVEDWLSRDDTVDSESERSPVAAAYSPSQVSLLQILDLPHLAERRRLLIQTAGQTAARDSEFLLVRSKDHTSNPDSVQLFRKPDDVWNLQNVADQCPDIVAEMTAWLEAQVAASEQNTRPD